MRGTDKHIKEEMGHPRKNGMADSDPVTSPCPKFPLPQHLGGAIKITPCQK